MDYLFAQVCLRMFQAVGVKKSTSPRPPDQNDWKLSDFLMFKRSEPEPELKMTPEAFMRSMLGDRVVKGRPPWSSD